MPLPSSFGRIVRRDGAVARRSSRRSDATPEQLALDEMNAGVYAFSEPALREAIGGLRDDNAQGEFYSDRHRARTGRGRQARSRRFGAHRHEDAIGINDRVESSARAARDERTNLRTTHARRRNDRRSRDDLSRTRADDRSRYHYLSEHHDLALERNRRRLRDRPQRAPVVRQVGDGSEIRDSIVVDSTIGRGVTVGPFAHVRAQGRCSGDEVQIGNFVEIKKSAFAAGSKAKHLSYVGDAIVGEEVQYRRGHDHVQLRRTSEKHETTIGRDVSIGSNTSLVAPVTMGDGALTGAGSVVTRDVPPGERVAGNPARPLPKRPQ